MLAPRMAAQLYKFAQHWRKSGSCPDCGGTRFVEDRAHGDTVCRSCGLVVAAHVWEECEGRRSFAEDGVDRSHVGAPTRVLDTPPVLATQISACGPGAHMLNRMQARTAAKGMGRAIRADLQKMDEVMAGQVLALPDTARAMCKQLYAAFGSSKQHKLPKEAMQAACVYVACRHRGGASSGAHGRDVKTIKSAFLLTDDKHFTRANKALSKFLCKDGGCGEMLDESTRKALVCGTADVVQQLKAGVELLGSAVPEREVWRTKRLCEWMHDVLAAADHFDGKHATTVCAGILVTACAELGLKQANDAKVAHCMGVAATTVREHAARVRERLLALAGPQEMAKRVATGGPAGGPAGG
jgi:transcription initiation factor TFIIIB Brf1 subunit/transcription initiation factor TFIIB